MVYVATGCLLLLLLRSRVGVDHGRHDDFLDFLSRQREARVLTKSYVSTKRGTLETDEGQKRCTLKVERGTLETDEGQKRGTLKVKICNT